MSRLVRLALVSTLLAGGLAACGKRGQLEPPPGTESARPKQEQPASATGGDRRPGETRIGGSKRVPITPPQRELLIDRLLD
jgi:predicted small lipoprotein YifL